MVMCCFTDVVGMRSNSHDFVDDLIILIVVWVSISEEDTSLIYIRKVFPIYLSFWGVPSLDVSLSIMFSIVMWKNCAKSFTRLVTFVRGGSGIGSL